MTSMDIASPMGLVYDDYSSGASYFLGALGIFLGIATVAWNIVAICYSNVYATAIGYGLWSGVIFVITGCFGIAAGKQNVSWRVITFMSLSLASIVCALVTMCLGIVDASTVSVGRINMACLGPGNSMQCLSDRSNAQKITIAMTSLLAAMGGLMAMVGVAGSCLGCRVACCGKAANAQVLQFVQRA
jgi:hypothetical protein